MGQPLKAWIGIFASLFLFTACGGDDLFTGDGSGLGGGDSELSSLVLLAGAPTLSSDASGVAAGITLTAIAKDSNNNVVPGEIVVFSTADSAEINVTNPAVTDLNGRVQAVVTTGGDPANRTINVTAKAGNLESSVAIDVIGTSIDISGPASTQFDVPTEYTVQVSDAAGNGIPDRTVEVTTEAGNTLAAETLVTNDFGQVTVQFTGVVPESSLTATALGLTDTQDITVSQDEFTLEVRAPGSNNVLVSSANTDQPVPELLIGQNYEMRVEWLRGNGAVDENTPIDFGATRGVVNQAQDNTDNDGFALTTFRSAQSGRSILTASSQNLSQPSARVTVEFVAIDPATIVVQANPSNVPRNQTTEITAVVRDAANNLVKNVTVEFSLDDPSTGTLSSPTAVTNSQGVAQITYTASSQPSPTEGVAITGKVQGNPSLNSQAHVTVGGIAANIALGTGSQIIIKDESTYQLPFTVAVTDSAGNPVPDADVRLTLFATHYFEGTFEAIAPPGGCPNEDINRNDILDPGENTSVAAGGEQTLQPGRVATVPATVNLDPDGTGQFLVTYAKSFGEFVEVEITATVKVSGTETTAKSLFRLKVAENDVDNLPGISPFGTDGFCETYDPQGI